MNKRDLFYQFNEWREDGEPERIIDAILKLPDSKMDDDYLTWLAESYIDAEEYKKAIAVLESQRRRMDGDYKWHFRMALALIHASEDEECKDDEDLRRNILVRANVALARGMNMNPPPSVLKTADYYMEQISDELDELDGVDSDENADEDIEDYDDDELDVLEEHIKKHFGNFPTVYSETDPKDIRCDICIIPPTKERDYFTLMTMGMGAHRMNIPKQFSDNSSDRAELLICLPPDWKVGENTEEWFWPFSLLKGLSRLPINGDTWLGWGHSVDNMTPFAGSTRLCGSLLIHPEDVPKDADDCTLPNGDIVNFYEVIPLYRDEICFKSENGTKTLLERLHSHGVGHVVDVSRSSCCAELNYENDDYVLLDCIENHSDKIAEKGLPLDKINGCNHIAIFLRWCIEHDLMFGEFYENFPDIAEDVKCGKMTDLRGYFLECFDGAMLSQYLNRCGARFADYYYDWDKKDLSHFYPADVDRYAEDYFGSERYASEEFKDEAYLFVPFDEEYYRGLSKYIDKAFDKFMAELKIQRLGYSRLLAADAEKYFGLSVKFVTTADETSEKEFAAALSQYKHPQLIIIDPYPRISRDDLSELFENVLTADAVFVTAAVADIPDMEEWARKQLPFAAVGTLPCDERTKRLRQDIEKRFGADFSILTFDSMRSELYLKKDNDEYLRFSDRGNYFDDPRCADILPD